MLIWNSFLCPLSERKTLKKNLFSQTNLVSVREIRARVVAQKLFHRATQLCPDTNLGKTTSTSSDCDKPTEPRFSLEVTSAPNAYRRFRSLILAAVLLLSYALWCSWLFSYEHFSYTLQCFWPLTVSFWDVIWLYKFVQVFSCLLHHSLFSPAFMLQWGNTTRSTRRCQDVLDQCTQLHFLSRTIGLFFVCWGGARQETLQSFPKITEKLKELKTVTGVVGTHDSWNLMQRKIK